jgi:hypothetical protein
MLAFRTTSTTGTLAAATNGIYNGFFGPALSFFLSGTNLGFSLWTAAGVNFGFQSTTYIANDNNWHLAFLTMQADGRTCTLYVDGVGTTQVAAQDMHPVGCTSDAIGSQMYGGSGIVAGGGLVADMAHVAQWNTALTQAQVTTLYNAWITAGLGESSGARYQRILRYAGYLGPQNVETGVTTSMGAAVDIPGVSALTALQDVVNTESGRHFVAADGTVTFQGRQHLSLDTTPVYTFGENPGELPYTDIQEDFDTTHVSNNITITRTAVSPALAVANQPFYAYDTTSQAAYGDRTFARNNQSTSAEECREAAYWYLSRYKNPGMRIASLKMDVAANPSLFPSALAFQLGQRIRVNRRPPSPASPSVLDGFIEQIKHTGDDRSAWDVELQVSPAPAIPYGVFTSLHTTLHAQANSGANTISINALPDAATNTLRSNLTGGQQLVLDFGLGVQETVTVAVGGVPVTSPGWTSATVTLTANLVNTHLINAVVCEPMPAGVTNPNLYDSSAQFDNCQFSY